MTIKAVRLAISGANGRMGKLLIESICNFNKAVLGAAIVRKNSHLVEQDISVVLKGQKLPFKIKICDNLEFVKDDFDVLIDFTSPEYSIENLKFCYKYNKPIVIGTTGFTDKQRNFIKKISSFIGIVLSPNFSIGVNVLFKVIKEITKLLGKDTDIEINECHHKGKLDAPSGTAIYMGKIISKVLNINFDDCAIFSRVNCLKKRVNKDIGFSVIRGGDIVGKHKVMFFGKDEYLEISHESSNRCIFAMGAIRSAVWIINKNNGLFNMMDVLEI